MKELKIKIKDLLNLTPNTIEKWYGQEVFEYIYIDDFFNYTTNSTEMMDRLFVYDYILDKCNDCRSRTLEILFLDEKPILVYQYIGKGRYENIHILDKDKLKEVYVDCMKEESDIKNTDINLEITVKGYDNSKFVINNNKIEIFKK